MTRLTQIPLVEAEGEAKTLLEQAQRSLGSVPNFMQVFASSPAALSAFLAFHADLHRGRLEHPIRERIALAIAEANACQYCVSAHSALGQQAGLEPSEIEAARRADSADAKARAAVQFARAVLDQTGAVTSTDLRQVREAGFGDAEIVEIISLVGLNVLTNLLGKVADVDIDFPVIELLGSHAA